jgi:hypothetical protein
MDFTSSQIGDTTACPDCFSPMEIREPGPEMERRLLSDDRFGEPENLRMEATAAETNRLNSPEALKQRADQLLERAAAAIRAEQRQEQDGRFTDSATGNLLSVFGQRETLARFLAISLLGIAAFAVLDWHLSRVLAGVAANWSGYVTGGIALGALGIWFVVVAAHGIAMLRGSMADLSAPIPWPPVISDAWLWGPLRIGWALFAAGLPGLVPGLTLLFAGLPGWLALPLFFASEAFFFPLALLALERRSGTWSLYEPGLGDELMAVWPATGTFYQVAALLGVVATIAFAAATLGSPWLAVLQGPVMTAAALAGLRLLGWLNIALITPSADE